MGFPARFFKRAKVRRERPAGGFKSKLEARYALRLDDLKKDGVIAQWDHEVVRLRIGAGEAWYTPDFRVILPDGVIEFHETKGHMREAARVRFLAARAKYPEHRFVMMAQKNGRWVELLPEDDGTL
jgi:hypothetical protein